MDTISNWIALLMFMCVFIIVNTYVANAMELVGIVRSVYLFSSSFLVGWFATPIILRIKR